MLLRAYLVLSIGYWCIPGSRYWALGLSIGYWYWVLNTGHWYWAHTWYWAGREGVKRPGPGEGVIPVSLIITMMIKIMLRVMK